MIAVVGDRVRVLQDIPWMRITGKMGFSRRDITSIGIH